MNPKETRTGARTQGEGWFRTIARSGSLRWIVSALLLAIPANVPAIVWGSDQRLTDDEAGSLYPAAAVTPGGDVHVVWADSRDDNGEIYYKTFDGVSWSSDVRLTDDPATSESPSIAVDAGGGLHVVWTDSRDGNPEIYYKGHDGFGWSTDQRLTVASGASLFPSVAVDAGGIVHVAWDDERDGNPEIYAMRRDGATWSPAERLTDDPGPSTWASICADANGLVHVAWWDARSGDSPEIYTRRYDGVLWGPEEQLTSGNLLSAFPDLAADGLGGVHLVWLGSPSGDLGLYAARWDGLAWGMPEPLADVSTHAVVPKIAANPTGGAFVVWEDIPHGNSEIYFKEYDGSTWDSAVRLTEDEAISTQPDIAVDPAGDLHVVWVDRRDGNHEIYAKHGSSAPSGIDGAGPAGGPGWLRCFPNPSRGTLSFAVPPIHAESARLRIHDLSGRIVREWRLHGASARSGEIVWDGRNESDRPVEAGVYLYELVEPSRSRTGRLVVVR